MPPGSAVCLAISEERLITKIIRRPSFFLEYPTCPTLFRTTAEKKDKTPALSNASLVLVSKHKTAEIEITNLASPATSYTHITFKVFEKEIFLLSNRSNLCENDFVDVVLRAIFVKCLTYTLIPNNLFSKNEKRDLH